MVYCGRPSKACERCRARRIKCNQQRPSCRQCQNAGVDCSGYRNEVDLLFRDQRPAVTQKYRKTASPDTISDIQVITHQSDSSTSKRKSTKSKTKKAANVDLIDTAMKSPSIPNLNQPIREIAMTYLINSYLDGSTFSYVPDMYLSAPAESMFANAVHAISLASFSQETFQPALLALARQHYARTLSQLKFALASPTQVMEDDTLASVLLLSRFETMNHEADERAISETWSRHVLGALSVLELRDPSMIRQSPVTLALFRQTARNINLHFIKSTQRLPDAQLRLVRALCARDPEETPNDPVTYVMRFYRINERFCDFRCKIAQSEVTDEWELIKLAYSINSQAKEFLEHLPPSWSFEEKHAMSQEELEAQGYGDAVLLDGTYHAYQGVQESQFWNLVRIMRLTLNDRLMVQLRQLEMTGRVNGGFWDDKGVYHTCTDLRTEQRAEIEGLARDICASSAQFLRKGRPECTKAAACFLVWPLFVAGRVARYSCADFVAERLAWIGSEMKISSSTIAANRLTDWNYWDDWLYACHMF